jgi:hypothetical protein
VARHPASERFHQILRELGQLHDQKQADYGTDNDPFANVRSTSEFGVDPWVGALIRLHDKVQRLKSLIANGRLQNESAEDSLRDIAVYSVIALVLREESLEEATREEILSMSEDEVGALIIGTLQTQAAQTEADLLLRRARGEIIPSFEEKLQKEADDQIEDFRSNDPEFFRCGDPSCLCNA